MTVDDDGDVETYSLSAPPGVTLLPGHTPKYVYDLLSDAHAAMTDGTKAGELDYYLGFAGIDHWVASTFQRIDKLEKNVTDKSERRPDRYGRTNRN